MGKTSLWGIPADHLLTLRNNQTGRWSPSDLVVQLGLPVSAGVLSAVLGANLDDVMGMVAGVSIVAGLLFSMAVFLFQLRLDLPNDARLTRPDLDLIDECMSNVLWAILWGLLLAVYLVVCDASDWLSEKSIVGHPLTGVAVGASVHFVLVIAMCLKRLRRAYQRVAMKLP